MMMKNWWWAILAGTCVLPAAHAQQYPVKAIRLLTPNAVGGGADATARVFGAALSQALGKAVAIDNRGGAGGNIATEIAAKSPPDGYTLVLGSVTHAISMTLYQGRLQYDLVKDFVPIAQLVNSSYGVTVHPAVPARSIRELLALARTKPGALNIGSTSNGTFLGGALLCDMGGVKMTSVSYKGGSQALVALMSGEIEVGMTSVASTLGPIHSGKLRMLAVTSASRSHAMPDLPTVSEAGVPGFEASTWFGLMTPTGTPPEVVARLFKETTHIMSLPAEREKFIAVGVDPNYRNSEQFAAYIRSEIDKWGRLVRKTGIHAD